MCLVYADFQEAYLHKLICNLKKQIRNKEWDYVYKQIFKVKKILREGYPDWLPRYSKENHETYHDL